MIYILLFIVGVAALVTWFVVEARRACFSRDVEPPTLGEPHIWFRLTRRLARNGLVGNARWRMPQIPSFKLESES